MTDEVPQSLDDHIASAPPIDGASQGVDIVKTPELVAEPPESSDEHEETDPAAPAKDEKGRFKSKELRENPSARVRQATGEAAAAKRERDEARAEAARLRAEFDAFRGTGARSEPEKERAEPKRYQKELPPDVKDFDSWEAYSAALAKDAAREEWHSLEAKKGHEAKQSAFKANIARTLKAADEQIQKAGGKTFLDTIDEAVLQLDPIGSPLGALIAQSDDVPSLMKYLSENADEFQLLQTLPPTQLSRKIGRLEEKLSGAATTATSTAKLEVSKAGPPVRPVAGKSAPSQADSSSMNLDQHMAAESRRKRA